jgi:hypothetical protein
MLGQLETDPLWAREYEDFARQISFAGACVAAYRLN